MYIWDQWHQFMRSMASIYETNDIYLLFMGWHQISRSVTSNVVIHDINLWDQWHRCIWVFDLLLWYSEKKSLIFYFWLLASVSIGQNRIEYLWWAEWPGTTNDCQLVAVNTRHETGTDSGRCPEVSLISPLCHPGVKGWRSQPALWGRCPLRIAYLWKK